MTPAVKFLDRLKISYEVNEYEHKGTSGNYGEAAAKALGQDPHQVFKTLLAVLDENTQRPVVAVIPVAAQLDLKKLAVCCKARRAQMAEPALAQKRTGYVVGGISPLAQKQQLDTFIDLSANNYPIIFVSAGKRGVQLALSPSDLIKSTGAICAEIARL